MDEVRTAPVKATFVKYEDFYGEEMRAKVPGSFCVDEYQEEGRPWIRWLYGCPCGCGASGCLRVQAGIKPLQSPSWAWNGSTDAPTLAPSVYRIGHWHGWLGGPDGKSPGMWISV